MKLFRSIVLILGSMVIASLLMACGSAADRGAESVSAPRSTGEVPRISPQELNDRLDGGEEILVIDTRGSDSYSAAHIAGSVMEPASFDDLARDQVIVTYCS